MSSDDVASPTAPASFKKLAPELRNKGQHHFFLDWSWLLTDLQCMRTASQLFPSSKMKLASLSINEQRKMPVIGDS